MGERNECNTTVPEYSFEQGLLAIMQRIHALLQKQDYVVVFISGPLEQSDVSVGKTTFTQHLCQILNDLQIPYFITDALSHFDKHAVHQLKSEQLRWKKQKGVIVLGAERIITSRKYMNGKVANHFSPLELPCDKMDIGTLIRRPDQNAENLDRQPVDMIVTNEKAVQPNLRPYTPPAGAVSGQILAEVRKLFQVTEP